MQNAMRHMYLMADEELLRRVGKALDRPQRHYAASTSVTLMLWNDLICVGHLGDSRVCLIYLTNESLRGMTRSPQGGVVTRDVSEEMVQGNFVTQDHKPDQPDERLRIEQCGGSVEYLHNHQNKPFIRGGDFQQRKLLGESPMQLQYSRAFGGKDLKPFGLISEPTISVTNREPQFLGFILASDGLWDVITADQAAQIAMRAYLRRESPAESLVKNALHSACDNITAVTVFFDRIGMDPTPS